MNEVSYICHRSRPHDQWCKSLLSIGGIICDFTPILPYFQDWGDEPRPRLFSGDQIKWRSKKKVFSKMEHLFSPKSGEDQKKRSSPEMEHLVSPNASTDLRSGCTQESNYWRGCRWRPYSNCWGDISPHLPRVSAPLHMMQQHKTNHKVAVILVAGNNK